MQESVQCPTRDLPVEPLFTHVIPRSHCLKFQSEYFHKCSRCAHRSPEPFYPSISSNGEGNGSAGGNGNGNGSAGANGHALRKERTAVRLARFRA